MKQQGIILFTTLMILGLLALIMVYEWQLVFLHNKMISHLKTRDQSFYALENFSQILMNESMDCVVDGIEPDEILAKLSRKGCRQRWQSKEYRYLMEDLGDFPCLQIKKEGQFYSSHHWRLSLSDDSRILQIRFVLIGGKADCRGRSPIFLEEGLVSWRYLSNQV